MGHPKMQRRAYSRPKSPFSKERLEEERKLMDEFGLRRKKELWRAETMLRNIRGRARDLQASTNEQKKKELIDKLYRIGLVEKEAQLDDVLDLKLKSLLRRRLQSYVFEKGLAGSIKHARQAILHKHVLIGSRRANKPSLIVTRDIEDKIKVLMPAKKEKAVEKVEDAESDKPVVEKVVEEVKQDGS
ncbi:MAG: 30S ribosomal protein S4 [Candidatus Aenigmatarchaeota archaeon]